MEIIGVVAEFNPFHKGHEYLISKIKSEYNPDLIVAVLSSSFVQRGEPAIFDKWTRTQMALNTGIDVVLELPVIFSCQNAEIFSLGAIRILSSFGITSLAFGTENQNLSTLKKLSHVYSNESDDINKKIKYYLNSGISYINSRNNALKDLGLINEDDLFVLSKSNNILGIEYLKAINKYNKNIKPLSISRIGVNHDSSFVKESITSASNIRNMIYQNKNIEHLVPNHLLDLYNTKNIPNLNLIYNLFKFQVLNNDYKSVKDTLEYESGIENRIEKFLDEVASIEELANEVSTKRITKARVRRIVMNSMLGINGKDTKDALEATPYIRILGFNKQGSDYLRKLKADKITNFKETNNKISDIKKIAAIETKATDLYSIITNRKRKLDYKINPIKK